MLNKIKDTTKQKTENFIFFALNICKICRIKKIFLREKITCSPTKPFSLHFRFNLVIASFFEVILNLEGVITFLTLVNLLFCLFIIIFVPLGLTRSDAKQQSALGLHETKLSCFHISFKCKISNDLKIMSKKCIRLFLKIEHVYGIMASWLRVGPKKTILPFGRLLIFSAEIKSLKKYIFSKIYPFV